MFDKSEIIWSFPIFDIELAKRLAEENFINEEIPLLVACKLILGKLYLNYELIITILMYIIKIIGGGQN